LNERDATPGTNASTTSASGPEAPPGRGWTKARLRAIERRLRERRAELAREIDDDLRKQGADREGLAAGNVPDSAELAIADWMTDVELGETERDVLELRAVEAALQRIAKDRFGECVDCGRTVEVAGLERTPHAARCLSCQNARERAARAAKPPTL
jgi:RNA polymerase-binding transcription factor DksA